MVEELVVDCRGGGPWGGRGGERKKNKQQEDVPVRDAGEEGVNSVDIVNWKPSTSSANQTNQTKQSKPAIDGDSTVRGNLRSPHRLLPFSLYNSQLTFYNPHFLSSQGERKKNTTGEWTLGPRTCCTRPCLCRAVCPPPPPTIVLIDCSHPTIPPRDNHHTPRLQDRQRVTASQRINRSFRSLWG